MSREEDSGAMRSFRIWAGFALSLLLLQAGACGGDDDREAAETATPPELTCHLAYRASPSERPEEQPALLLAPGDVIERISFEELAFEATYSFDRFEGAALFVDVFGDDGPPALLRTLYQLPSQRSLQNQFEGGHGFTGLVFVRAPTSAAELQYWCTVNEER